MKYNEWKQKRNGLQAFYALMFCCLSLSVLAFPKIPSYIKLMFFILLGWLMYTIYTSKIKKFSSNFYVIELNAIKASNWFHNIDDEEKINIHKENKSKY